MSKGSIYPKPGVCPGGLGGSWNNVGLPEIRHTDAKKQQHRNINILTLRHKYKDNITETHMHRHDNDKARQKSFINTNPRV